MKSIACNLICFPRTVNCKISNIVSKFYDSKHDIFWYGNSCFWSDLLEIAAHIAKETNTKNDSFYI
jgi:hypothetical protein